MSLTKEFTNIVSTFSLFFDVDDWPLRGPSSRDSLSFLNFLNHSYITDFNRVASTYTFFNFLIHFSRSTSGFVTKFYGHMLLDNRK